MKTHPKLSDQEIAISLLLRIDFTGIEILLRKKFNGTNISKTDTRGKVSNYFKILDLNLAASSTPP